jgi:hypothetical protein
VVVHINQKNDALSIAAGCHPLESGNDLCGLEQDRGHDDRRNLVRDCRREPVGEQIGRNAETLWTSRPASASRSTWRLTVWNSPDVVTR